MSSKMFSNQGSYWVAWTVIIAITFSVLSWITISIARGHDTYQKLQDNCYDRGLSVVTVNSQTTCGRISIDIP